MNNTFVKDVMKKNVISIDASKSVKNGAELMATAGVGSIIITRNNKPVGILTERDFVKKIVSKNRPLDTALSEVMSSPLIAVQPQETIWEAAELMKTNNIHKLPVKDGNSVIGIITSTDLVEICSLGSDSSMRKIVDQIILRMEEEQPKG